MQNTIVKALLCGALTVFGLASCGAGNRQTDTVADTTAETVEIPEFSADSAYQYVKTQVDMGPRVPNTPAHRQAQEWIAAQLRGRGAEVVEQVMDLRAFDGTILKSKNIMGRFRPEVSERILILAHYDCRPWADEDPDPAKRSLPVDGANDAASGTGVILELARLLQQNPLPSSVGVDLLLLDAEDWGSHSDEDSWALGAKYFVENPPVKDYKPSRAILLDMVGGKDATFYQEYFSVNAAPQLVSTLWRTAAEGGYTDKFPASVGSAVTDDHRPLIDAGIPAVDIIDYRAGEGFDPVWHTTADNMDNISPATLKAVGQTLTDYLWQLR